MSRVLPFVHHQWPVSALWLLLAVCGTSSTVSANGFLEGSIATGWEDNLTRGFWSRDQHDSAFLGAELVAGKLFQPLVNTSLIVSGSASYHSFPSLQGFNRLSVGTDVTLQQKFGLGPYSPRLSLTASAVRDALDGRERDRDLYLVQAAYSQRLSPAWSMSLSAGRETSRGRNEQWLDFSQLPYTSGTRPTDPMDYYNNVFAGSLDYEFTNGWLLSGSHQYIDGYIVPTAIPPVFELYSKAKAVALDPAFNHHQLMYLLKSRSRIWGLNLSVPLSEDSALDFVYSGQDIEARHVGDYSNFHFSINLLHRF